MSDWSAPDNRGIQTKIIYLRPNRRVSGERCRAAMRQAKVDQVLVTNTQRMLLQTLLQRFRRTWRWDSVMRTAGHEQVETARQLVEVLLEAGYVHVTERCDARGWQTAVIEPVATNTLRQLAGLAERDEKAERLEALLIRTPRYAQTQTLLDSLQSGRLEVRLRRAALLDPLDRWLDEGRAGTRRDFALFSTGDTKGVPQADWYWLERNGALDAASVVDHVPHLLAGGTFTIFDASDRRLDMAAARGPLGLPPTAIHAAAGVAPPVKWVVIENRGVFDKACKLVPDVGVLWVPGYAPNWWLDAVDALLLHAPAPGVFACDPDPAGMDIALRISRLWEKRGLKWCLAAMDGEALDELPVRKPLSAWDRQKLESLGELPAALERARAALVQRGQKGEQEGYFEELRLRALVDTRTD